MRTASRRAMTTRGFARHERSLFWLVVAFLVIAAAGRSGRGPAASLLGPARHQRQSLGSSSTSVTTEASTSVTTVPPSPATTVPSTSQTVPSTPVTTPNASTTSTSIVANGDTQAFSAGNCVDFDQREEPRVVTQPLVRLQAARIEVLEIGPVTGPHEDLAHPHTILERG